MSAFHTKLFINAFLLALLSGPALAQTGGLALPPSDTAPPQAAPQATTPAALGLALPPTAISTVAPSQLATQTPTPAGTQAEQPATTQQPVQTSATQPITAKIEETPLKDVKPDSIGLIANTEGGLGAGLWKGTSRTIAEHFTGMLSLPLPYPSLNHLAERFLLTTAGAPESDADTGKKSALTSARADKLIALGHPAEAWKLANLADLESFDDEHLRQISEAALISPAAPDVCKKLPDLIKKHTAIEWQKLMVVCQLQAKDTKAAQLSLDLLHAQDVHDDVFFALAEKNVITGYKQLPRPLTPLKPLVLALLRLADLPVRGEIYAHPDAVFIPEILKVKSADEKARLALAERAAVKGIISAPELGAVYRDQIFTPDAVGTAAVSIESGPTLRALLYQASLQEKDSNNRIAQAIRFLGSLDGASTGGEVLSLMGNIIGDTQPDPAHNQNAADILRIYTLAGKGNFALAWLDLAQNAKRGIPQVATDLQAMWPLLVLSGLEPEKDFQSDLTAWLGTVIRETTVIDAETKAQRTSVTSLLLLMDAIEFSVPDDAWAKVADSVIPEKTMMPPAIILEHLHSAAAANRKGETILMGLLAETGGKEDPPLLATLQTIRALRAVGLTPDAGNLAKDVGLKVLYGGQKP